MDKTAATTSSNTKPVEQKATDQGFMPFEQRESQHVKPWGFLKSIAITIVLAKLSYVAGHIATNMFSGKGLGEAFKAYRNDIIGSPVLVDELSGKMTANKPVIVGLIFGTAGALTEAYLKWRKGEHKRLMIHDSMEDVKHYLVTDTGEKELESQRRIEKNIKEIIALREGKQTMSHADGVTHHAANDHSQHQL